MKNVEKFLIGFGATARLVDGGHEQDFVNTIVEFQNKHLEDVDFGEAINTVESLTKKEIVELLKKGFNLEK